MQFLELWQEGKNEEAILIAGFLGDGSKEKMGTSFLLDPRPVSEKEADFRQKLPDNSDWFADFMIGEQYLKNGNQKEAIEAYSRSYRRIQQLDQSDQSIFERLLIKQVVSRFYFGRSEPPRKKPRKKRPFCVRGSDDDVARKPRVPDTPGHPAIPDTNGTCNVL